MSLIYRDGEDGGLDITIQLTEDEAKALDCDAMLLTDWMDTVLWSLAMLRLGRNPRPNPLRCIGSDSRQTERATEVTPEVLEAVITHLEHRLAPKLQGLRDAVLRYHFSVGGTLNALALAMDAPKSTAQSRRNAVVRGAATYWETWATGDHWRHGPPWRQRQGTPEK